MKKKITDNGDCSNFLSEPTILRELLLQKLESGKIYNVRLMQLNIFNAYAGFYESGNLIFCNSIDLVHVGQLVSNLSFSKEKIMNIFYDSEENEVMQNENNELFTMSETAKKLNTTRPKLFEFLKKFNFIIDKRICPALKEKGYFIEEKRNAWYGSFPKKYNIILVTEIGIDFILKFAVLIKYNKLWQ